MPKNSKIMKPNPHFNITKINAFYKEIGQHYIDFNLNDPEVQLFRRLLNIQFLDTKVKEIDEQLITTLKLSLELSKSDLQMLNETKQMFSQTIRVINRNLTFKYN
jgi:hypothetical protein